ncbi:succinyl-diaminopimelate desuccinylase [Magnetococcales bacterium HHB-1]
MAIDPLPLLKDLIQIRSDHAEDKQCQALITERLNQRGFHVHQCPFGSVHNIYARLGEQSPNFCFAGHTDVVPAGEEEAWRQPPYAAKIEEDIIYGRGACDMKGGLAAMITAVENFLDLNPQFIEQNRGSISFLITGDEEGDAVDGTVRVLEWLAARGEKIDLCLVGEPSSAETLGDCIKNGRRGSINGEITVTGVQGHVAYPHKAENPIHGALVILDKLASHRFDQGNDYFQPTSFQFTAIHSGGHVTNVIPGQLNARFNIRFNTEHTPESLIEIIEGYLQQGEKGNLRFELKTTVSGLPFLTPEGSLTKKLISSIKEQIPEITPELSTGGGTSDARFISRYCPETVEFGLPGGTMHKVNESILVDDLRQVTMIYQRLLEKALPQK